MMEPNDINLADNTVQQNQKLQEFSRSETHHESSDETVIAEKTDLNAVTKVPHNVDVKQDIQHVCNGQYSVTEDDGVDKPDKISDRPDQNVICDASEVGDTHEKTASQWDCPNTIASSSKMTDEKRMETVTPDRTDSGQMPGVDHDGNDKASSEYERSTETPEQIVPDGCEPETTPMICEIPEEKTDAKDLSDRTTDSTVTVSGDPDRSQTQSALHVEKEGASIKPDGEGTDSSGDVSSQFPAAGEQPMLTDVSKGSDSSTESGTKQNKDDSDLASKTGNRTEPENCGFPEDSGHVSVKPQVPYKTPVGDNSLVYSSVHPPNYLSDEDSEDEAALHIDEDRVTEDNGETGDLSETPSSAEPENTQQSEQAESPPASQQDKCQSGPEPIEGTALAERTQSTLQPGKTECASQPEQSESPAAPEQSKTALPPGDTESGLKPEQLESTISSEQIRSTAQYEQTKSTVSSEHKESTVPIEQAEGTEQMESTISSEQKESALPIEQAEGAEQMENTISSEQKENALPIEQAEGIEQMENTISSEQKESALPIEQAEGTEQTKNMCQPEHNRSPSEKTDNIALSEHLESPLPPEETESPVPSLQMESPLASEKTESTVSSQQTEESAQQVEKNNLALAPDLTETRLQPEQACATQSEQNGNTPQPGQTNAMIQQTSQREGSPTPPERTTPKLPTDTLRLKDLKIKLEKFKEINRSWQKRKPEHSLAKSDKLQSTQVRTNIFDAFNASLSPASNNNADGDASTKNTTNISPADQREKDHEADIHSPSEITDRNHQEGETVSPSADQADSPRAEENNGRLSDQPLAKSTPSENRSIDNDHEMTAQKVQKELQELNSLLGSDPPVERTHLDDAITSTESESNAVSSPSQSGGETEQFKAIQNTSLNIGMVADKGSEQEQSTCTPESAPVNCEKSNSNTETEVSATEQESLEQIDDEQIIKISEIFTVQTNSKEHAKSVENSSSVNYSKTNSTPISDCSLGSKTATGRRNDSPTITTDKLMKRNTSDTKRQSTESLLDLLNKSGDDQASSVKRTPQKPTEVNWPDYGVNRCPRCNFTTSDEALLQVHTCKRSTVTPTSPITSPGTSITTVQSILSTGSSEKSVVTTSMQSLLSPGSYAAADNSLSVSPSGGSQADQLAGRKDSGMVTLAKKKIKVPPPFPKVWKNIKCRILRLKKNLFYCTICNHKANYPLFIGHLVEHMLEYPYTCPYCSKPGTLLFQRSVDITAHINTHSNVSHKFSMFGFSSAKAFLDKVSSSGAETISGIFVDPKNIVEGANIPNTGAVSFTQTSSSQTVASLLASQALMSSPPTGLLPASTSLTPTLTSLSHSSASFTQPLAGLTSAPTNVTSTGLTPVSHGLTPATVLTQVNNSTTLVNTLIPASAVTGNQRLIPCGAVPATLGSRPNITTKTVTAVSDVIRPVAPTGNPVLLFVPAQGSASTTSMVQNFAGLPSQLPVLGASNVAASGNVNNTPPKPVQEFPVSSVQKDLSGETHNLDSNSLSDSSSTPDKTQHSPNILRRKKSGKSVTVTVGRQQDNLHCFGCNYSTVSMAQFRAHIWRHLHADSTPCKHSKVPQAQASWTVCPFVEGIITSMPVVSSNSNHQVSNPSTNKSAQPGFTCHSSLDRVDSSLKSKTIDASAVVKTKECPESLNNQVEGGNDDSESDCEIIAHIDKPVPILIDLADDDEPSEGETHTTAEAPAHGETHTTAEPSSDGETHKTAEPPSHGETHTTTEPPERETRSTAEEPSGGEETMPTASEQTAGDNETELRIQSSYSLSPEDDATVAQSDNPPTPQQQSEVGQSEKDLPSQLNPTTPETSTLRPSPYSAKRDSMFYVCGFTDCMFSCIMSEQFKHHLLINHRGANQYPCAHCGHKSSGEEELFRHMLSHTTAKMFLLYKCGFPRCRFGTNLISEFQQHNGVFHENAESYRCAMCKTDYPSLSELCKHFQASLLKFIQCPYCSVKSKDRRTIIGHIAESHPDKPRQITVTSQLVCHTINQEKIQASLESRRNSNSEVNHGSRASDRGKERNSVGTERTIQKGLETENNSAAKDTASVEKVNTDVSSHQVSSAEGVERFQCAFCSHKGPHEMTVYNCRSCKFNTSEYIQMEAHMQSAHPNQLQCYKSTTKAVLSKEFKCQVCPYSTSCPVEREKHFSTHEVVQVRTDIPSLHSATAAKPNKFTCPECKQKIKRYRSLEEHIRKRHTEVTHIQLYRCQICPFSSTALRATVAHFSKAHPGTAKILRLKRKISKRPEVTQTTAELENPELDFSVHWFHCEYCTFSSSLREDLEQHLKSHSQSTAPKNDENNKTENRNPESGDVEHTADTFSIPPENTFKSSIKCPHCEYSTNVRVKLLRHIKHHKSTTEPVSDGGSLKGVPWKDQSPTKGIVKQNILATDNATDLSASPQQKTPSPSKPNTLSPSKTPSPKKTSPILPSSPRRGKYDINPSGSASKSGQEFYKCRLCPFKATNVQSLYGHLRCHKSLSNHKCSYCNFKSTNKVVMMNHQRKEHGNSANKCEEPNNLSQEIPDSMPLEKHDTDNLQGRKRKLSSKSDSTSKRLKVDAHSTPSYECVIDKCGFKIDTINALEEHFKTSHQVKAFVCSRCKFQSLRLLVMETHLAKVHKQKQMLYKMSDTGPKVSTNSPEKGTSNNSSPSKSPKSRTPSKSKTPPKALESDGGVHSKEHFKCGLCSSIMRSRSTLVDHSFLKHGFDVEPVMVPVMVHKCVDCGVRFRNLTEAKQHNMACLKRALKESELTAAAEQAKQASHPVVDSAQTCTDVQGEMAENKIGPPEAVETQDTDKPVKPLESSGSQDFETKKKFRSPETYMYSCQLCEHTGTSRQRMKEHYFVHYKYFPFKCVYCPKAYARADRLQKHTVQVHPGKVVDSKMRRNEQMDLKIDRLLRQNRKLISREELDNKNKVVKSEAAVSPMESQNTHVVVETPSGVSKSKESALQSVKEYDPDNPFHCELCKFTTRSKKSLQKHMLKHDPPRLKCSKCDHKSYFPYLMRSHYQRAHPGEEISIIRIPQDDSSPKPPESSVTNPKATGSGQKRKAGEETVDSAEFTIIADEDSESKILAHMPLQDLYCKFQDQINKTSYKCLMCDLEVPTSGLIAAHMYKHMPKCFQCFYCSFRSYPSSAVTSHMRRNHDGQPRKFKFFKEQALEKYNQMLSKLGKLPFQLPEPKSKKPKLSPGKLKKEEEESDASECDSCVTEQPELKRDPDREKHRTSISSITNFCCHLCAFKVRDQSLFAEHLSLHEIFMTSANNQDIAKCGFCSFSSNNAKEFNEHVSTHVSERPYKCSHCEHSCFSKAHMRSHIKSKHPGQKMSYSDKSTDRTVLVRETTPVDTTRINFDARVILEDILFLETATFDELVSSFGITSADLQDLSNDKFNAVLRASGLSGDDIYDDMTEALQTV